MTDGSAKSKLSSSAGILQHEYKRADADVFERVIFCALPVIWLSNEVFPAEATPAGKITVDPTRNLTVYADVVIICGKLSLAGRNMKIVARKLIFMGEAAIVTDGNKGKNPIVTQADPKPVRALDGKDGHQEVRSDNGAAGFTLADLDEKREPRVKDGTPGDSGTDAGNIEINVEKWVGDAMLSARGGDGARGQDGQDGQDGGDGGKRVEWSVPDGPPVWNAPTNFKFYTLPPGDGGRGGDAGRDRRSWRKRGNDHASLGPGSTG